MKQYKSETVSVYMTSQILFMIFILVSLNIIFAQSKLIVIATPVIPENQEEKRILLQDSLEAYFNNDSVGSINRILSLPSGNSPEGITIDRLGNIYISNTKGENGSINEILHVGLNGSYSVFATLPGKGQARGLATDSFGNLYVAFATKDINTNGVYRIGRSRLPIRLEGSEKIGSPNSITFDNLGNLYVTDSYKGANFEGAVWYYNDKFEEFKILIKDQLLNGGITKPPAPPMQLPGANGIAFYPPNKLYVANTLQNSILLITIGDFEKIPTIELVKKDFLLMNIDGIIVDEYGNIYGVLPPCTLGAVGSSPVPPLIKLDIKSGVVFPVVEDNSYFDTPTSLAFVAGNDNYINIFITNAALQYGQPPMAGPGVVKVQLNTSGNGNE